mgnify:CR=1 FL=1
MKPMTVSDDLAEVIGPGPMPRSEVVKALWVYIKKHKLQDPKNKRRIIPDAKLAKVFGSKAGIDMMQLAGVINKHFI